MQQKKELFQTLSKVSIFIFLYIIVSYFYIGLTSLPSEGDSVTYHIPNAMRILNGTIFNYVGRNAVTYYYPSSSEAILAFFLLLHIPLNLYNVVAIIVLFFVLIFVGRRCGLASYAAILYASSICTANVFVRNIPTQKNDVWMTIFFLLTFLLLRAPKQKASYFLLLGATSGMVIGSKYAGLFFLASLFIVYGKNLFHYLSIKNTLIFFIPFSLLGLIWYVRNYLLVQSPIYPQTIPFTKTYTGVVPMMAYNVGRAIITHPLMMFNAFLSEYLVWIAVLFAVPLSFLYYFKNRPEKPYRFVSVAAVSLLCFFAYLTLPADNVYGVMVYGIRYTYPFFVLAMLALFLFIKQLKLEKYLAEIAVANMLLILPLRYAPKLLFAYIPLVLFSSVVFDKLVQVNDRRLGKQSLVMQKNDGKKYHVRKSHSNYRQKKSIE